MHLSLSLIISLCILFTTSLAWSADRIAGNFSTGDLSGWETKTFKGLTKYQIVESDGRRVLGAECSNAASALYRRFSVKLSETPILRWSWRVDQTYPGLDETRKPGDDYPARIYVVIDGGALLWRTKALNYVWASQKPAGSIWPNAFTGQARMIAIRSGAGSGWVEESRDLRTDFRTVFGLDADHIDGVALMTDCDNSQGSGRAWYGDIRFTAN